MYFSGGVHILACLGGLSVCLHTTSPYHARYTTQLVTSDSRMRAVYQYVTYSFILFFDSIQQYGNSKSEVGPVRLVTSVKSSKKFFSDPVARNCEHLLFLSMYTSVIVEICRVM